MYKNFFGLHENPFSLSPDPRFLFLTPQIQEETEQLTYGVSSRKGLILLTGEVGTGKTTLVNYLLDWLRQKNMPTAFIFNSHLTVTHLFDFILNDFGISTDFRLKSNMLLRLNEWLLERCRAGSTPVLIVDEAQGLSLELLEEIRLLLNLETASEKLLQIVLVGQPELEEKLKRPEMRQIRQRIALRCNTSPLTLEESRGYIADRLRIAGAQGNPLFASDAVEAAHFYSRGIPRVMNLLCEHALINAYVEHLNPVPAPMVEEAARDFLLDEFRPLAAPASVSHHLESKVSVMQPLFTSDLVRPFASQEKRSREAWIADLVPVSSAGASTKSAFFAKNGIATTPLQVEANVPSDQNLDTFQSVPELVPRVLEQHPQLSAARYTPDPLARQVECATELMTAMARMLESASSSAAHRVDLPKANHEPSPIAASAPTSASRIRVVSLDDVNRVPSKSARTWVHSRPLLNALRSLRRLPQWSSVAAAWLRLSVAIPPKFRQSASMLKMLARQWKYEFKRDWNAMIGAIPISWAKRSLLQWFREPM